MRRIRRNILKHLQSLRRELAASGLALALLAGCGGGGAGAGMPSHALPSVGGSGTLSITIHVPAPAQQVQLRSPKYVSPDTQYIGINYLPVPNSGFSPTQLLTPSVPAFSVSSSGVCTSNASTGQKTCAVNVSLIPGTYSVAITTWDGAPNASNNTFTSTQELSQTILPVVQVVAGAGAALGNISASLDGIPANVAVTPLPGQSHVAQVGQAYEIVGMSPINFLVEPVDAAGNIIVGQGAPTIALPTASHPDVALLQPFPSTIPSEITAQVVGWSPTVLSIPITVTPANGVTASPNASINIETIQELWTGMSDAGSPIGGIAGYALLPESSGAGFAPPSTGSGSAFNSTPIDEYIGVPPTGLYADDDVAVDPHGNLWAVDSYSSLVVIEEFGVPTNSGPLAIAQTLAPPSTAFSSATTIAFDAQSNLWAFDPIAGNLYEYAAPSYSRVTSTIAASALVSLASTSQTEIQIPQNGPYANDIVVIAETKSGAPPTEIIAIDPPFSASSSTSTVLALPSVTPTGFAFSNSGKTLWTLQSPVPFGTQSLDLYDVIAVGSSPTLVTATTTACSSPTGSFQGFGDQMAVSFTNTLWNATGGTSDTACEYANASGSLGFSGNLVFLQTSGGAAAAQYGVAIAP